VDMEGKSYWTYSSLLDNMHEREEQYQDGTIEVKNNPQVV